MSNHEKLKNLQYMADVGVPSEDVAWLAEISRQPLTTDTEINRAKRIVDMAYNGLCATIKTPGYRLDAQ